VGRLESERKGWCSISNKLQCQHLLGHTKANNGICKAGQPVIGRGSKPGTPEYKHTTAGTGKNPAAKFETNSKPSNLSAIHFHVDASFRPLVLSKQHLIRRLSDRVLCSDRYASRDVGLQTQPVCRSKALEVKVTMRLTVGRSVSQSVSKSWRRAPSGAHGQILITLWQLRCCFVGRPL
jgi:hypothetical protein